MKSALMEILACPACKSKLNLESPARSGDDVVSGTLRCTKCGEAYPIKDGIPNLLPPEYRDRPASSLPGAH
ncbi:MAG: Trm112 family protein [Dehalococcoidia bacterium]|nr:Trm112 family protein [Dehalococcoidia bacterium]MSQ34922.1 Trm112 family protein [Dehalococcoidia bacterium]